jgi:RNA polymerase sigma-70 factor (ECF subfamily)
MQRTAPPDFVDVYRRGANHVWATLRACGVPERHLEDATHDVFLIVLALLPTYEPRDDTRLEAWLSAIARRVAANARRAERRRPVMEHDVSAELADPNGADDVAAELVLALRLLDEVSPDARRVFILHEVEERPINEVARELDIPEGTAWTRLRQARRELASARQRREARSRRVAAIVPLLGTAEHVEGEPAPPMPPEVQDRILARLKQTPEYARYQERMATAGAAPPSPPRPPEVSALAGAAAGALALGVLLGALWDPFHRPAAPVVASAAPVATAAASVALVAPSASGATTVAPQSPPQAGSAAPTASASTAAALDSIAAERALLRDANDALAGGHPDEALALVAEHASRFRGGGHFSADREATWIAALAALGRTEEALARADQFDRSFPKSARVDDLRRALTARDPAH